MRGWIIWAAGGERREDHHRFVALTFCRCLYRYRQQREREREGKQRWRKERAQRFGTVDQVDREEGDGQRNEVVGGARIRCHGFSIFAVPLI